MEVELASRQVRMVYLITYSQADLGIFPDRETFSHAVVEAFSASNRDVTIVQWVCAAEKHINGGTHYHMAVKLSKCYRWLPARRYLAEHFGINVNFSNVHSNYYTAWEYCCKEDDRPLESDGHPDLWNTAPPRTMAASQARHLSQAEEEEGMGFVPPPRKRQRLRNFEFAEIVLSKSIKTRVELLALANSQRKEGKTDLCEFIFSKSQKTIDELMSTAWAMENAQDQLERSRLQRITILERAKEEQCNEGCNGAWEKQAGDVLQRNNIPKVTFAASVFRLLKDGRGKYRNILLLGPANCGKTFLLSPLSNIYKTFANPASTSFAWIGAEQSEVIVLNDFRWSPQIIAWSDLLLLLEGEEVHLPAPKTHFSRDIVFSTDAPIFCTSSHQLVFVKGGQIDERETEMMSVRWKIFHLNSQISREEQRDVPPCGRCFASLVLSASQ